MNNNPNYLSKAVSRVVATGALGIPNYETLPSSGLTRIVDWHSSMFVVPIDISNPESDYLLFDGGMDTQARELERFLDSHEKSRAKRGLGLSAIKGVFLTHAHADHVGALHALAADVPVFISKGDSETLRGAAQAEGPLPMGLNRLGLLKVAMPWLKPELIVHDQEVAFGQLTVGAIATPGHTGDGMSYTVRRGGEDQPSDLVVGDALDYRRDGSVKNANRLFTSDTQASHDSIIYLSNYQKERGIWIADVATAHSRSGSFEAIHDYAEAA